MRFELRDFVADDAPAVNRVALAAFSQYRDRYEDWESFSRLIGAMDMLAVSTELIVATLGGEVVGAVAYVAPEKPKATFFEPDWAVLRILVVEPSLRGQGIGRALTDACVSRAVRDGATTMALHTSPIMEVALAMYLRMGFKFLRAVPPIHGVSYGVYVKPLFQTASDASDGGRS
ncbi:MAG: GNAT family N-acetyltransferase [Chromatiales bacterium]|jgi:ribosomal protein S18 acetylase RimI-like enzyme|nr:GNAT family N-acetyltransferase [Chromatiales bacterium]MDX9766702.1 GNAT family N-acetyltransferase [Ectothiorhodospiraceae bacterium]